MSEDQEQEQDQQPETDVEVGETEVTPDNEDIPPTQEAAAGVAAAGSQTTVAVATEGPSGPGVPDENPPVAGAPSTPASTVSGGAPAATESSAEGSATETRTIVPTALNPDTWPDRNKGTVTDPEILARHGLSPMTTTTSNPANVTFTHSTGAPVDPGPPPSADHELFKCLVKWLPTGHLFWSDSHRREQPVICPQCGSNTVIRAEG